MGNCVGRIDADWYVSCIQSKDGSGDPSFPVIKDQTQFSVAHARYSKVSFCLLS